MWKKHPHTQTYINEHIVPGPLSTSWTLALIDVLTCQSCQWKWQIHFAGFIHRLPAKKTKIPGPCHHRIATHWLPPDWLLPSRPVPDHRDLVPGPVIGYIKADMTACDMPLCWVLIFKGSDWSAVCPEYTMFPWVTEEVLPLWEEIIIHWTHFSCHGNR